MMRTRRFLAATIAVLLSGCDPLDRTELTLSFDDTGEKVSVQIVADTGRLRVLRETSGDRIGDDILAARDEWSIRLANAQAGNEQILLSRTGRELTRVEHRAQIAAQHLDRFFSDISASVQVTRGDGWCELTIYPGTSTRATRQQQQSVNARLRTYSAIAVRYFEAVKPLYRYMDDNPHRVEDLFTWIYAEPAERPEVSDDEHDLVAPVREAAELLAGTGDEREDKQLARDADLVFNPFPARLSVVVPSEPLAVEGFTRGEGRALQAATATPFEAVSSLEGRWISPDPLAVLTRAAEGALPRQLAALAATEPRRAAAVVTPGDVSRAIVQAMQPAPRYRLRWIVKSPAPGS
jgi:hypothetical protein